MPFSIKDRIWKNLQLIRKDREVANFLKKHPEFLTAAEPQRLMWSQWHHGLMQDEPSLYNAIFKNHLGWLQYDPQKAVFIKNVVRLMKMLEGTYRSPNSYSRVQTKLGSKQPYAQQLRKFAVTLAMCLLVAREAVQEHLRVPHKKGERCKLESVPDWVCECKNLPPPKNENNRKIWWQVAKKALKDTVLGLFYEKERLKDLTPNLNSKKEVKIIFDPAQIRRRLNQKPTLENELGENLKFFSLGGLNVRYSKEEGKKRNAMAGGYALLKISRTFMSIVKELG